MDGLTRVVCIGDREFTARELTVSDLRKLYKRDGSGDFFDENLIVAPGVTLTDLGYFYGETTPALFDDCNASQLKELAQAAKELNPGFFDVKALYSQLLETAMRQLPSNEPSEPEISKVSTDQ